MESVKRGVWFMRELLALLSSDDAQDIAEYAVMLAVILVIVVGTLRLVGSNSNTVFSQVASSIG
jgi:Flp pilus assembly pilin Flp